MAARVPGVPVVTMTAGLRRASSAARSGESLVPPLGPPVLDGDVLALYVAKLTELLSKSLHVVGLEGRRGDAEVADPTQARRLLRAGG